MDLQITLKIKNNINSSISGYLDIVSNLYNINKKDTDDNSYNKNELYELWIKYTEKVSEIDETKIIKIQKWFRGCIMRKKQLPLIMYKIKKYLELQAFQFCFQNQDGRTNSLFDEVEVIKLLIEKFGERIKKAKDRMWYDILALD